MKLTDLAILFIVIVLPFMLVLRIQSDNLQGVVYRTTVINRYLDTAVEDACEEMIVSGSNNKMAISRDKALRAFYETLYTNFGVLRSDTSKITLSAYIPAIVMIDHDGYSVCSMEEYTNSEGDRELRMVWKPKKPYVYMCEEYVYLFTLDRQVKVYDSNANKFYEGTRQELMPQIQGTLIQQEGMFEDVRKRTIVEAIKRDVNEAINTHNAFATQFGISYHFCPPFISDSDWYRNIEDIGFLAFFQGLPIGLCGERYNHFALGAARIVRKNQYYIQQDMNGLFYYHRDCCDELTKRDEPFDTREECALEGAFPCPVCNP